MTAFDNIRLEKGLYASGDFTGALEKIDPSENYSGTALEGLDAYQRQLKRFNIKVSGQMIMLCCRHCSRRRLPGGTRAGRYRNKQ